ncbi:MAG: cation transporter [Elusimicrobia bacterium]|nr:MAG: cation transporter [Elusimicrobiota bacterium]
MASLIGNFLVAVVKFFAAAVTGSAAMTSEGIHSIVDTGNQVLILYGLRQAAKPPSKEYPFGRGRELYFWSFVVAISIFAIGALVSLGEGVHRLMEPSVITNPMVNYIVLALAMVFEGYAWKVAYNKFRQSMGKKGFMKALRDHKDPAVFLVLFEDSAALVGLAIAALGIALTQATGILYFDGIAALLIGVVLAITAFFLARETKSLLIGESADPEIVQGIKELAMTFRSVESVNDVLTMQLGANDVLVNLSIEFRDEESTGTLEATIAALVKAIKARFPDVKRVFVEAADHK